jgi:hypothetical protein
MSGLYNTMLQEKRKKKTDNTITREKIRKEYERNINKFLRSTVEAIEPKTQKVLDTDIFFGHVTKEQETKKDPAKNAFQRYRQPLLDHYTNRYTTVIDFAEQNQKPRETISMIHDWLQDINNTNKKLIFEL